MDLQAESHKKTAVYRVWTYGKRNPEAANAFTNESNVASDNKISNVHVCNLGTLDRPDETFLENEPSTLGDTVIHGEIKSRKIDNEISNASPGDMESNLSLVCTGDSLECLLEPRDTSFEPELSLVSTEEERQVTPSGIPPSLLKPSSSGSYQRYPCLSLTVDSTRREKRILERLQVCFIIHSCKALFL